MGLGWIVGTEYLCWIACTRGVSTCDARTSVPADRSLLSIFMPPNTAGAAAPPVAAVRAIPASGLAIFAAFLRNVLSPISDRTVDAWP
jgi:hypothetical protein